VDKILLKSALDANLAEILETKVSIPNLFQELETFAEFYKTQF
jgi:hypothetical protein